MTEEAPLTVGEEIDKLYALRAERLALNKKVDALKAQEAVLRQNIISRLQANGLDSGRGSDATASITKEVACNINDWPAFAAYVLETNSLDLLQKRVSMAAIKARWEDEVEVPGTCKVELPDLSLVKRRKVI